MTVADLPTAATLAAVRHHLDAVSEFWPGLASALRQEHVTFSTCDGRPGGLGAILGALVEMAEDVRLRRHRDGDLACAVLVVTDADMLLDVPLWTAVNLYAPVGLTFHLATAGDDDETVPAVPASFYLLRPWSPVWHIDESDEPDILPASVDDGRDVLLSAIGKPASPQAVCTHFPTLLLKYGHRPA